jgi:cytochrome oxidase Cu insertion factor (SCO1/SenC/PrrC family)
MNFDFRLLLALWALLAASVIALIVWRKMVASHEDDQLHVMQTAAATQQAEVAHKLEVIDKWGKSVTAVTVAYGVLIAGLFIYQTWMQSSTTVPGA